MPPTSIFFAEMSNLIKIISGRAADIMIPIIKVIRNHDQAEKQQNTPKNNNQFVNSFPVNFAIGWSLCFGHFLDLFFCGFRIMISVKPVKVKLLTILIGVALIILVP